MTMLIPDSMGICETCRAVIGAIVLTAGLAFLWFPNVTTRRTRWTATALYPFALALLLWFYLFRA